MPRRVCPELYPDPRPSRLFAPLLAYLPALLRAWPWLAAAPAVGGIALLAVTALPLVTWVLVGLAMLAPIAAGLAFTVGWE